MNTSIKGRCLWFDERDGHGVVEDEQGNEYYSDTSAIIDRKPLKRGEQIIFVRNEKIKNCACAIVIARETKGA